MKIGLFFGSFNPIHVGHLIIANVMAETTDLDKVWFVVSPQNPFKKKNQLIHEFDRLDMVRAAIHENFKLDVTDIEFNMPRPSYTVDTLAFLSEKHPEKEFSLIIGGDNLRSFPKWKNHEVILENYSMYVYPRPNAKPSPILEHPNVTQVEAPLLDISATFIRKCVAHGQSITYMVHPAVEEIIHSRKYYLQPLA